MSPKIASLFPDEIYLTKGIPRNVFVLLTFGVVFSLLAVSYTHLTLPTILLV